MYIADLHIHSKYSRATSRECVPEYLDLWARRKGIDLLGTGDFTHPAWRRELKDKLAPAEDGLYQLKEDFKIRDTMTAEERNPRFVISGEISSIYKKNGKTRKVHNLILLPGLEEAEQLSRRLEAIGNIHSDGRPILGLDSRDLLEITLETCPRAIFIPAHIWTPHFSLFGAFSGFDTIEECFEDLTGHIHALETGLSSDPPMNWRLSALDSFHLVSNSDAHSPAKLGREANLLDIELSYEGLYQALQEGKGLAGTLEFFPEEGKYHMDGHRKCDLCLSPVQTSQYGGRCPVCGKKITIGVLHRVEQLADRQEGYEKPGARHFESLVPLPEVIAASTDKSAASVKVQRQYEAMLAELGTEFSILRDIPLEAIRSCAGPCIEEGIRRLRQGKVERIPGYDGEYGIIKIIDKEEIAELCGQVSLFESIALPAGKKKKKPERRGKIPKEGTKEPAKERLQAPDNLKQQEAVTAEERAVAVIAGPGTGKTHTLIEKIAFLIQEKQVAPAEITAVTFTKKAAEELKHRIQKKLGKRKASAVKTGTFHSICLELLKSWKGEIRLADEQQQMDAATAAIKDCGLSTSPFAFLRRISAWKSGVSELEDEPLREAACQYAKQLREDNLLDFDDLLTETLVYMEEHPQEPALGEGGWLLVDEFQDVSLPQYRLIRQWAVRGKALFVIGDPDQCIYGFRGAVPQVFRRLKEDYPDLREIRLELNYRSTPEILENAISVISRAPGAPRQLKALRDSGKKARLVTAAGDLQEAIYIAKEINQMTGGMDMMDAQRFAAGRETHRSFGDIAVLYRTHHQARLLESCLRKESIPCVVTGKDPFLQEKAVKETIHFFRALLEEDREQMEAVSSRLFAENPRQTGQYLAERFLPRLETERPSALLRDWAEQTGLKPRVRMDRLGEMAVFYDRMDEFLDNLLLGEEQDIRRSTAGEQYRSGAVSLMTFHGAKGLEFPVVFLCGVKEGVLPMESADPEEERRLFYVGMTRAKEELILTAGNPPSEFLEDLPLFGIEREETLKKKENEGVQLDFFHL